MNPRDTDALTHCGHGVSLDVDCDGCDIGNAESDSWRDNTDDFIPTSHRATVLA